MKPADERIKKIYELAMHGVAGEKETAQALLDKLLVKYKISLEDVINDESKDIYFYKFHDKAQKTLLVQIFYKVTNSQKSYCKQTPTGRINRTELGVECTAAQKIEIDLLYDFYFTLWGKEQDALLFAFIQKHQIFGDGRNNRNPQKHTREELDKMVSMMNALSDESPHLRINDKS